MSEITGVPGGNEQLASGDTVVEAPKKDSVAYETHLKLLSEKKKLKEELESYQRAAREREEADLRAKDDFKKIAELRETEAKELREKLSLVETRERNALKLDAFLSTLDGQVDRKFWGHINLNEIAVDPSTGDVDQMSVAREVEKFKKEYFEIIKRPGQSTLPSTAPQGASGSSLSYDDWKKLPSREMKARLKDVVKPN